MGTTAKERMECYCPEFCFTGDNPEKVAELIAKAELAPDSVLPVFFTVYREKDDHDPAYWAISVSEKETIYFSTEKRALEVFELLSATRKQGLKQGDVREHGGYIYKGEEAGAVKDVEEWARELPSNNPAAFKIALLKLNEDGTEEEVSNFAWANAYEVQAEGLRRNYIYCKTHQTAIDLLRVAEFAVMYKGDCSKAEERIKEWVVSLHNLWPSPDRKLYARPALRGRYSTCYNCCSTAANAWYVDGGYCNFKELCLTKERAEYLCEVANKTLQEVISVKSEYQTLKDSHESMCKEAYNLREELRASRRVIREMEELLRELGVDAEGEGQVLALHVRNWGKKLVESHQTNLEELAKLLGSSPQ